MLHKGGQGSHPPFHLVPSMTGTTLHPLNPLPAYVNKCFPCFLPLLVHKPVSSLEATSAVSWDLLEDKLSMTVISFRGPTINESPSAPCRSLADICSTITRIYSLYVYVGSPTSFITQSLVCTAGKKGWIRKTFYFFFILKGKIKNNGTKFQNKIIGN